MQRFLLILCGVGALSGACVNVVDPDDATQQQQQASPQSERPGDERELPGPADDDEPQAPSEPTPESPPGEEAPADDEVPGDEDGDGVVNVGEPGPPPAEASQACVEWTDCGPHYDDLNSGFDCENNVCACDATGQWATACADIGGSWSGFECFCFTNTETLMPTAAPETPDQAEDDVVCWWSWRHRYCDPDEWVDTSYYEEVCYGDDCYWEYVEDGYYIDGQCYGRWIKRCTDGNEYWY